jgi:ABC-type branched-subunit amino acid transport system ATPase component
MLECRGLSKRFDGVNALRDVSFKLSSPRICAIIGPNGAGKTTLLNVLTGFLRPDAGRWFLSEFDLTRLHAPEIVRLGLARTFQEVRLIRDLAVIENVLLAVSDRQTESLLHAIAPFGLHKEAETHRARALSELRLVGLDSQASQRAGNLSYGQQKLLSIACCLATNAKVLLFDEPVAGVDPTMIEAIGGILRELRRRGKLVVFVEHDIAVVRQLADTVIVLDDGAVIAEGSPADVLDRPDIVETFLA